jgi:DNA-binding response OmpR family regulator
MMKVLLVDDEEELVTALAERLSYRAIEADWASSGSRALELVEANPYDVAVLDVKMPNLSGIELKRRLEKVRSGMKYIFLTGHGSEDDFRAGKAEASLYLVKPLDIETLIEAMQKVVES